MAQIPTLDQRAISPLDGRGIEASGAICTARGVLLVGDETRNALYALGITADGCGRPERVPFGSAELDDLEAIARAGSGAVRTVWLATSHSNNKNSEAKAKRQGLARLELDEKGAPREGSLAIAADPQLRAALEGALRAHGVAEYEEYNSELGGATRRFANLEGLVVTPGRKVRSAWALGRRSRRYQ